MTEYKRPTWDEYFFEVMKAIAETYLQLNMRWLITGQGDPLLPEQNVPDKYDLDISISKLQTDILEIKKQLNKIESK